MQLGLVANKRITELFRQSPVIENAETSLENYDATGNIKFRDVSVLFGEAVVLDDINLEIPLGQTVAIAGRTGSGKTTLVNLLPRMNDVTTGSVEIDGIDVREYRLNVLRDMIGFVPQEAYLFSDSIINNLEYGQSAPTPESVATALNVSRLSKDLEQLDNKLDTLIGERGASLSGGQKQRAALARTVLKNAPILVLDDSLSHVDTNTEEEILAELKIYMKGRTTLLIAHRTSTLRTADTIVMLQNGKIVESGPHTELVTANGPYAQLYKEQLAVEALGVDLDQLEIDTPIHGVENT
jgi:ATP-binding cassette subfamily B protein